MSRIDQPRMIRALRRYFASGWAFLIPYQLAYLLYYWRQWPSNPGTETAAKTAIPSLLVVYWAMHALHIALALLACASAKREEGKVKGENLEPPRAPLARRLLSLFTLHSSLFWISLALLFYIPGVYLEFPADPLMHLRRITEWQVHEVVHWHTAGYKSLYFFAYSLVGWLPPAHLLFWVNLYHVAICLLLSWQYYCLARDAGLPKRWAQGFVLLHALLFGNFCFSFFRYYSLASTAFAQLGTVALIRIAIDWTKQKNEERKVKGENSAQPAPRTRRFLSVFTLHFSLFSSVLCAALLVVNNHVQGLGIAALGCASVLAWKLGRWPRRAWVGWLTLASLLAAGSLAVYYGWPRSPKFAAVALESHWLTPWQGLNFFPPDGTGYPRSMAVLGMIGVLNLAAGLYLCLRRQLAGWLTLGPLLLLALPLTAVPLADNFARENKEIITFTRMLFSIPAGLALVALAREITTRAKKLNRPSPLQHSLFTLQSSPAPRHHSLFSLLSSSSSFVLLLGLLFLLTILPASHPWQNHFWHALARPPADLNFAREASELAQLVPAPVHPSPFTLHSSSLPPRIGSTTPITRLLNAQNPFNRHALNYTASTDRKAAQVEHHYTVSNRSPTNDYGLVYAAFETKPYPQTITIFSTSFYTPYSQAAQNSTHWNPIDALLATTGMPELEALSAAKGLKPHQQANGMILWKSDDE